MDSPGCRCLAERSPSLPSALRDRTDRYSTFLFGPKNVDLSQVLSKDLRVLIYRIRLAKLEGSRSENDECDDSDFGRGWNKARREQENDISLLTVGRPNRDDQSRSNELRATLVGAILELHKDKFTNLPYHDALAQYRAMEMVSAYYRSDECLQCAELVDCAQTDIDTKQRLERITTLFTELGEPLPVGLRDWASGSSLAKRSQKHCQPPRKRGRPPKNWNRNQRISFAVFVLVVWAGSSQYRAFRIVSRVWNEQNRSNPLPPDEIRKIWRCHKRTYD